MRILHNTSIYVVNIQATVFKACNVTGFSNGILTFLVVVKPSKKPATRAYDGLVVPEQYVLGSMLTKITKLTDELKSIRSTMV